MTQLIGIVVGPSLQQAKEQMDRGRPFADLFEIRLDLLDKKALSHLKELDRSKPLIFTLRTVAQGGMCELPEEERLSLFETCLKAEPEYCDIESHTELAFFEQTAKLHPKTRIICSFHDLEKVPDHLDQVLERMKKDRVSHYKIAVQAHSINDCLHVMAFAKEHENLTCIAMGIDGQASRILAPIIGSEFCYSAIDEKDAAFGQLDLKTLCELYHFKKLGLDTDIYGLIGDPVERSIGHLFHNKSFPPKAVYVKLHVAIPDLPLFFSLMRKFPFRGFSVTMPLKEQMDRILTRIDPASQAIGSINTVVIEDEHLIGYNTDGPGALNALEKHKKVKGSRIGIIGAGGSGRAIAYEALQRGARVTVFNRTIERAQSLAQQFGCQAQPLEELTKEPYDVLINTVPVDLLFNPELLHPSSYVMDIVYWEKETPLLKAAKERGCVCIGGIEMFEEQARLQQQIWFSKKPKKAD